MKLLSFLKYVLNAASYGVLFAIALMLLVPDFQPEFSANLFKGNFLKHSEAYPQPLSYAKAVSVASPAVVNIYSEEIQSAPKYGRNARQTTRLGSGVIMDANGYILTNYHVIQNANLITVLLQSGQEYPAELIGADRLTDLAVLKVNATNMPVIPQHRDLQSFAGDIVLAIGNPFNLGQTVTQGIISATGRSGLSNTSYREFLQMDAAINDGNSGGALVNSNGVLVGINSHKFTQENAQQSSQGIFFAIPYRLAYKVMQQVIENGRVIRGWLGISAKQNLNGKSITIDSVTENSPAASAGLMPGDVVYQIDNQQITSITQALDIVAETRPNTTILFKIHRKNKPLELSVTIVELR